MMEKRNDLHDSLLLISNALDLEQASIFPEDEEITEEELIQRLSELISYLLDKDLEKLLNALYRIDVNEIDVKRIFAEEKPDLLAKSMARLILERQKEKLEYRRKFRNPPQ